MAALWVILKRDLSYLKSLFKVTYSAAIYFCAFSGRIVSCLGPESAKFCSRSKAITEQGAHVSFWANISQPARSLHEQFGWRLYNLGLRVKLLIQ